MPHTASGKAHAKSRLAELVEEDEIRNKRGTEILHKLTINDFLLLHFTFK